MAKGLEMLVERPDETSHPHLVVITDGEDNASKEYSLSTISSILSNPGAFARALHVSGGIFSNFHCSLISVGSEVCQHVLEFNEIVEGKTNMHHFRASEAKDIATCFEAVSRKMQVVVETYTRTTEERIMNTKYVSARSRN